jgi:menaquinone-dependent protoporphyrinogen oxidase
MTAIIYMSKHGTTEKVALGIFEELNNSEVELIDLRKTKTPDITDYDTVIIGGSIHAGSIQKRVMSFCEVNMDVLLKKRVALFICCMYDDDQAKEQFDNAFPKTLRNHSIKNDILGGEFLFDKMNFFERVIVKKIAGTSENVSQIDEKKIKEFAKEIA